MQMPGDLSFTYFDPDFDLSIPSLTNSRGVAEPSGNLASLNFPSEAGCAEAMQQRVSPAELKTCSDDEDLAVVSSSSSQNYLLQSRRKLCQTKSFLLGQWLMEWGDLINPHST